MCPRIRVSHAGACPPIAFSGRNPRLGTRPETFVSAFAERRLPILYRDPMRARGWKTMVSGRVSSIRVSLATTTAVAFVGLCCDCGVPKTPHAVGALSDDSCLQCHRDGAYGAASIDHADRRHCVSCHEARDFRPVPHSLTLSDCLSCHERGTSGAPATSHPGIGAYGCQVDVRSVIGRPGMRFGDVKRALEFPMPM